MSPLRKKIDSMRDTQPPAPYKSMSGATETKTDGAASRASNAESDRSYTPPAAVAAAAVAALEARATAAPSNRGMTPVGLARARDLSNRRPISLETVKRMAAYFSRHAIDKEGSTWDEKGKGWQAWNGWGGDPGARWARSILSRYAD